MKVHFSQYTIQVQYRNEVKYIYDIVRKKWIKANPEEEVRQLWLHYLVNDKAVSSGKIAVEKGLYVNDCLKRFDICIYDVHMQPNILIECKAPMQKLDIKVLEQLARYNLALGAQTIIVTNGLDHKGYTVVENRLLELEQF